MEDLKKTSHWDEITSLSDEDLSQVSGGAPEWTGQGFADDFVCDHQNDVNFGKGCYYDQNYNGFTFPWRCCNKCANNPKNCK